MARTGRPKHLSPEEEDEVYEEYLTGLNRPTIASIARKHHVSRTTVFNTIQLVRKRREAQ